MTRFLKIFARMIVIVPLGFVVLLAYIVWPLHVGLGGAWFIAWMMFNLVIIATLGLYLEETGE